MLFPIVACGVGLGAGVSKGVFVLQLAEDKFCWGRHFRREKIKNEQVSLLESDNARSAQNTQMPGSGTNGKVQQAGKSTNGKQFFLFQITQYTQPPCIGQRL